MAMLISSSISMERLQTKHGEKYIGDPPIFMDPNYSFLCSFIDYTNTSVRAVRKQINDETYLYPVEGLNMTIIYSASKKQHYVVAEHIQLLRIIRHVQSDERHVLDKYEKNISGFYKYVQEKGLTHYLKPIYGIYVKKPRNCANWKEHMLGLFDYTLLSQSPDDIINYLSQPITEFRLPILTYRFMYMIKGIYVYSDMVVFSRTKETLTSIVENIREDNDIYLSNTGLTSDDFHITDINCNARLHYMLGRNNYRMVDHIRHDYKLEKDEYEVRMGEYIICVKRGVFTKLFNYRRWKIVQYRTQMRPKLKNLGK